jgi:hypothetical protein
MSEHEFIYWLKGFVAGSNQYNLTPAGWDKLKEELEKVKSPNNEDDECIDGILD